MGEAGWEELFDEQLEAFDEVEAIQHIEDGDLVGMYLPGGNGEKILVGYIMREYIDAVEDGLSRG